MQGKLFIIPTPIGNLEDMTLRAIRILKEVDLILAEDTRTSGVLLKHFEIGTRMSPFHQHNEHRVLEQVIGQLQQGGKLALISDAGTPGISDPGFLLVRACVQAGIDVETLPGPSAVIPALVNSGLPADRFVFEGFLPVKKGRQTRLECLREEVRTIVLYESPHRLVKTLEQLSEVLGGDRQASVARELSKLHEEHVRGTLNELIAHFTEKGARGEIVLVVAGAK
ncbi:MAG: 16S rRNA (cytidine(1402)-2'-O)-methyltransferase [Flavobacteriales bacterium]|nr:16S rRNA (cytidine(1402)-2'-O)-methyltransferase [Flavobacteriales bacterium]MCB9449341.1 16S rRNA (cytidine(1402)-2'-O)-methyltransferase [Flavobacteriales bacterium]